MQHMQRGLVLAAMGLFLTGCIIPPDNSEPPEEAILAGDWELTGDSITNLESLVFTFNDRGKLTQVVYQLTGTARITDTDPRGEITVSGQSVTIDATRLGSGTVFTGTLNDSNTQIVGSLTTRLEVGSIIAEVDQGAATFTRQ